jgi:hypothetical protein
MRIIRFQEELHSTNSVMFKKAVYRLSGIRPQDHLALIKKVEENKKKIESVNQSFNYITKIIPVFLIEMFEKKSNKKINADNQNIYSIDLNKKGLL